VHRSANGAKWKPVAGGEDADSISLVVGVNPWF
jgi:hypothetical protein